MAERDPLTQQYIALWELLEMHKGFDELVKVGNRPKLIGSNRAPLKPEALSADLPEVRVFPTALRPHLHRTSNGSSFVCGWQIQVVSGEQLLDTILLPLMWEILRAMANWQAVLSVLTWRGKHFVKLTRAGAADFSLVADELHRGITGWMALWSCETESFVTTAALLGD